MLFIIVILLSLLNLTLLLFWCVNSKGASKASLPRNKKEQPKAALWPWRERLNRLFALHGIQEKFFCLTGSAWEVSVGWLAYAASRVTAVASSAGRSSEAEALLPARDEGELLQLAASCAADDAAQVPDVAVARQVIEAEMEQAALQPESPDPLIIDDQVKISSAAVCVEVTLPTPEQLTQPAIQAASADAKNSEEILANKSDKAAWPPKMTQPKKDKRCFGRREGETPDMIDFGLMRRRESSQLCRDKESFRGDAVVPTRCRSPTVSFGTELSLARVSPPPGFDSNPGQYSSSYGDRSFSFHYQEPVSEMNFDWPKNGFQKRQSMHCDRSSDRRPSTIPDHRFASPAYAEYYSGAASGEAYGAMRQKRPSLPHKKPPGQWYSPFLSGDLFRAQHAPAEEESLQFSSNSSLESVEEKYVGISLMNELSSSIEFKKKA